MKEHMGFPFDRVNQKKDGNLELTEFDSNNDSGEIAFASVSAEDGEIVIGREKSVPRLADDHRGVESDTSDKESFGPDKKRTLYTDEVRGRSDRENLKTMSKSELERASRDKIRKSLGKI